VPPVLRLVLVFAVVAVGTAACGDDDAGDDGGSAAAATTESRDATTTTTDGATPSTTAATITTTAPAPACGDIVEEAFDPASPSHVLPGAPEPTYLTDPPTSGPHQAVPAEGGVRDEPLGRPVQVGLLEHGLVLVQYRPADVAAADVAPAATDQVVVAPNDGLPAPVVATAWLAKRECSAVDLAALAEFVRARAGHGPDSGH
jgi:hypothetical protein